MLQVSAESRLRAREDRIDELREENRQLRERIAELTGANDAWAARKAFGLTDTEARVLMLIVRCGQAEYRHLEDSIWGEDDGCESDNPGGCIRSHVKRLRRKIRPHGVDIGTIYGFGFAMDEATRAKVRKILAGVTV